MEIKRRLKRHGYLLDMKNEYEVYNERKKYKAHDFAIAKYRVCITDGIRG